MAFISDETTVRGRTELRPLLTVAREAIAAHLERRSAVAIVAAEPLRVVRASVFVTLWLERALRGCIGEIEPQHSDVVAETELFAVAAAVRDPRFETLTLAELRHVRLDVTVLGPIEPVESPDELDPRRFGVVVGDRRGRRGVLLPGVRGVASIEQQIAIARTKAGIHELETLTVARFSATKISES